MQLRRNRVLWTAGLMIALIIAFAGWAGGSAVYAGSDTVLTVYQDDKEKRAFTKSELEALTQYDYDYSGFNSWPTPQMTKGVTGVRVTAILEEAGVDVDSIGDRQLIRFVASDGISQDFLKNQILGQRWYFPNVRNEAGRAGKAPLASSWNGKQQVPAMISMKDDGDSGRLCFGQVSPTEQNFASSLKYMISTANGGGKIIVRSEAGPKWNALRTASPGSGSAVQVGTSITLDRSVNDDPAIFTERYCIYFTTDGSEPSMSSAMYNYNNFNFGSPYEKFNRPVIAGEGVNTIRTRVVGYGAEDSAVSSFHYTGYTLPAATRIKSIKAKKKALKLTWARSAGAEGYRIFRATKKNGKYKLVRTVYRADTTSWTNKKLKKKKKYFYKIQAFRTVAGKTVYSSYSAVKYKKTK